MIELAGIAMVLGIIMATMYVPFIFIPEDTRIWLNKFPRNKSAGRILTAVDLVWAGWLLFNMPLGRFEELKPLLYVLVPVSFFLIINFMDELLAPRALGGLLLLIPTPMLSIARWNESEFRLVISILAYIFILKGIMLVLYPYMFRKIVNLFLRDNNWCRTLGIIGSLLGMFILFLGLVVF